MRSVVYHQCAALYITNAQHCISPTRSVVYHQAAGEYTLLRDEIQGRLAALDDIRRTSRVNDIPSPAAWIATPEGCHFTALLTRDVQAAGGLKIRTPCACQASLPIFGRGMRTPACDEITRLATRRRICAALQGFRRGSGAPMLRTRSARYAHGGVFDPTLQVP